MGGLLVIAGVLVVIFMVLFGSNMIDEKETIETMELKIPNITRWYKQAKSAANEFGVPWQIVLAQIWQESSGDPKAIGAIGEVGLMQVTPGAAQDVEKAYGSFSGWKNDPQQNIRAGTAYLKLKWNESGVLADALGKTKADALESYNEGYGNAILDLGPDEYSVEVIEKAKLFGYGK